MSNRRERVNNRRSRVEDLSMAEMMSGGMHIGNIATADAGPAGSRPQHLRAAVDMSRSSEASTSRRRSPRHDRHRRRSLSPPSHGSAAVPMRSAQPHRNQHGNANKRKTRAQVNVAAGGSAGMEASNHTSAHKIKPRRRRSHSGSDSDDSDAAEGTALMLKIGRAFLARLLFVIHSLIAIWQTVKAYDNPAYWGFALISVSIMLEGAYAIILHAGDERKWFCPSVMLYILCTAPPIWALELDMSYHRMLHYKLIDKNTTTRTAQMAEIEVSSLSTGHEFSSQLLEQLLLVILILGRWLLPKGEISREQLSQILLAYLAISSDIVELFDVFKERPVVMNPKLQYLVLTCWFLSLLQFPFVLTVSKARKMRVAITHSSSFEEIRRLHLRSQRGEMSILDQILRDVDIWAILLANMFQDVPFLITRLILMLGFGVVTYTMIFFTCKNLLIILLQSYRASVIIHDRYQRASPDDDARRLIQHYTSTIIHSQGMLKEMQTRHSEIFAQAFNQKVVEQARDAGRDTAMGSLALLKQRAEQRRAAITVEQSEPLLTDSLVEHKDLDEYPLDSMLNTDHMLAGDERDDERSVESLSTLPRRRPRGPTPPVEALLPADYYEQHDFPRRSRSGGFEDVRTGERHGPNVPGSRPRTPKKGRRTPQQPLEHDRRSTSSHELASLESPRRRRRMRRRDSDLRDIFEDEHLYATMPAASRSPRKKKHAVDKQRRKR